MPTDLDCQVSCFIIATSTVSIYINIMLEGGADKLVLLSEHGLPVGIGEVCLDQAMIHGQCVPSNYIKIAVEYVKPGTKPALPLTFDDDELCAGQFTIWPKRLTKNATL